LQEKTAKGWQDDKKDKPAVFDIALQFPAMTQAPSAGDPGKCLPPRRETFP
jgi:hypothetical protein